MTLCAGCMVAGSQALLAAQLAGRPAPPPRRLSVRGLVHHAARLAGEDPGAILGRERWGRLVRLRHAVVAVALRHAEFAGYELSLPTVGNALGCRDHSTVINSRDRARMLIAGDPEFAWLVERLWAAAECDPRGDDPPRSPKARPGHLLRGAARRGGEETIAARDFVLVRTAWPVPGDYRPRHALPLTAAMLEQEVT